MSAGVTFWQLPEDEREFLIFLAGTGNVLALPSHWVKAHWELTPKSIASYIEQQDPPQVELVLESHVSQLRVDSHVKDSQIYFSIPTMKNLVIGYNRCRFHSGKLCQSNLSADWAYPNEDATEMVRKSEEFIRWAKRILAWARKATPEKCSLNGYEYRATKRVKEAVARGELELTF
jgi:hypothetical protein